MNTKKMILTAPIFAAATLNTAQGQVSMVGINKDAPVKCERSIVIHAKPDEVWAVMTNIEAWPKWQTEISKAKLNGPVAVGTTFTWKTGGAKITSKLHTVEKTSQFGWTGKTFGMEAIHNWQLESVDGGTKVTVSESLVGFLTVMFKKSFNKSLEKGMVKWLELLQLEVEKK